MRALLVGSRGRSPFAGHFRGRVTGGSASLAWAGRLKGSAAPETAWSAAERARDVLSGLMGADRFALIDQAWAALRSLEGGDLSVLLVAKDEEGLSLAACGLADVRVGGQSVAPAGHPLFDEPGVRERPGYFHPELAGEDWVGLPVGMTWPQGDIAELCGARKAP